MMKCEASVVGMQFTWLKRASTQVVEECFEAKLDVAFTRVSIFFGMQRHGRWVGFRVSFIADQQAKRVFPLDVWSSVVGDGEGEEREREKCLARRRRNNTTTVLEGAGSCCG